MLTHVAKFNLDDDELESANSIDDMIEYSMQARLAVMKEFMSAGPENLDVKTAGVILKAADGIDKSALRRISIEVERGSNDNAEATNALANKLIDELVNGNIGISQPMPINPEALKLPDNDYPEGAAKVGISKETASEFTARMESKNQDNGNN